MTQAAKQQKRKRKQQRKPRTKPPTPALEVLRNAELVPVKHYPLIDPAFSEPALRWLLFHRDENGLAKSGAVVEFGRRLLLRPKRFAAWLESQLKVSA